MSYLGSQQNTIDKGGESTAKMPPRNDVQYVTPAAPPKDRQQCLQEPNIECTLKHYPYAKFKAVMDLNSNEKSNSNKGNRKAVIPSFRIPYECVFFSFSHLKTDDRLPNNVLDEISKEEDIQWKG